MNTVLKYPGSKWSIAPWIIETFPAHHTYIEPYFGSGAVLFNKPPSAIETVNDLDKNIVNLFKLVRECPEEIAKIIAATPYSRFEYDQTFEKQELENEIEQARRFLVQCWQGHGFRTNGYKVGWKNDVQGRENMYAVHNWYRLPEWILGITDRLKQVQIECSPALQLIKRHKFKRVLIYADPPYCLNTRTAKQYLHEMTEQDHVELLETLIEHPGPVAISGYESALYNDTLKGWYKKSTNGRAEYQGQDRLEVLWMNYEPPMEQISIFDKGEFL